MNYQRIPSVRRTCCTAPRRTNDLPYHTPSPRREEMPPCTEPHHACPEERAKSCLAGRSLAMVYAPCQEFESLYTPEQGLCRGTLFADLDKPFLAGGM